MKTKRKKFEDMFIVTEMVPRHYLMTEEVYRKYQETEPKKRKALPILEISDDDRKKIMKRYKYTEV